MSGDITDLLGAIAEQERLEAMEAEAAHALAEAEEAAEDGAGTAEVERCRKLHATAEAALAFARARRRELEAGLPPREVARAYALRAASR